MAEETRGVFTLKTVRNNILNDEFVTPNEAFFGVPQGFDTGYNAGGATPGAVSITDKTTYTTDTTARVPGANINTGDRKGLKGCGSATAGYYGGGFAASDTVNKMPYSTETMATLPGTLNAARGYLSACSSDLAGYWSGGAPGSNSSTDKCTFSTDTVARAPGANLSVARAFVNASGNTQIGFIGGGFLSPTYYSTMDKLSFSGDFVAQAPAASMTDACEDYNASANGFFGYFAGGFGPGSTVHSRVDKCNFVVDTTGRIPGADLSQSVFKQGQTGTALAGYLSGGQTPARISTTQKLNYSTETTTTVPGAALSGTRSDTAASSSRNNGLPTLTQPSNLKNKASFGYGLIGGGPLDGSSTINKIDYTTDVVSHGGDLTFNAPAAAAAGGTQDVAYVVQTTSAGKIPYATLTAAAVPSVAGHPSIYYGGRVSSENALYAIGGSGDTSNMIKLTYATETSENLPAKLALGATWPQCFSNLSAGYAVGRDTSNIQKVSFITETCNLLAQKAASVTGQTPGASGFDAGYTIQGNNDGTTVVGKLTYATETHADIPRMFTQIAMSEGGTTGHGGAGYYMMGYTAPTGYVTTTTKTNYITETSSRLPAANARFANRDCFCTSSQDFNFPQTRPSTPTLGSSIPGGTNDAGYIGGGLSTASPGHRSDFDKVHFATDTIEYLPGTKLSAARYRIEASASATAGYYGGGKPSGPMVSTMDKLTFSTESCAAVPGAALSDPVQGCATASCETHSYWAGGTPGYRSDTDKLTFSSDTTSLTPSAQLEANTFYGEGGCASFTAMYMGGGVQASPISSMARITFSNDTRNQVPSGALIASKYAQAAGHNTTRSYFVGGNPGPVSTVSKFTYATETTEEAVNYPQTIYEHTAFGNATKGYFANGNNPATNYLSNVYKLDYTTETFTFIGNTFLSQGNADSGACSAKEGGAAYTSNTL